MTRADDFWKLAEGVLRLVSGHFDCAGVFGDLVRGLLGDVEGTAANVVGDCDQVNGLFFVIFNGLRLAADAHLVLVTR